MGSLGGVGDWEEVGAGMGKVSGRQGWEAPQLVSEVPQRDS